MNNICFNERQNIWTTKYSWTPLISENINGKMYSVGGMNSDITNNSIWVHSPIKEEIGDKLDVSKWYNKLEQFEFEFVVSDPIGVSKIFDNLQIISNNVQPKEMEITVIGDDYEFKRDVVDLDEHRNIRKEVQGEDLTKIRTTSNIHGQEPKNSHKEPKLSTTYHFDWRLNQSVITKIQEFKDIYKYGRRIGNIQYKDGMWFAQIEPLRLNNVGLRERESRIRDKWARIRIKYSGEDLAVITAIRTLINV